MSSAVRLTGISKSFGLVQALQDVTLEVAAGSIHALVGENGAGKTTLMRVLYGALKADSGSIEVEGRQREFRSSADATAAGVGMVSQHYGVIPALTCLENLVLGAERSPILRKAEQAKKAQELAARMGFQFDWFAEASSLSPAATQKLEILKLLWRNSRIMVLDEPTAMLSPADSDALFDSLRSLVDGGATVILVTHRLPEVMNHCSTVTVLRGGLVVAERTVSETSDRELARLIVGESSDRLIDEALSAEPAGSPSHQGAPVLQMRGVSVKDERRYEALQDVNLEVRSGEVVGVAGVDGNGQRELLLSILGAAKLAGGQLLMNGVDQGKVPSSGRLRDGLRLIPEDRHSEALVERWSIEENAALGLHTLDPIAKGALVDLAARRSLAERVVETFRAKQGGLRLPMASLSGGNQQRVVAARALQLGPKLLVAFQPARGLDIGGTADVYEAIRQRCQGGMAALVISFDLDELLTHCDRVVVLNHGKLNEPPAEDARNREVIGRLMVGAA